MPRRKNFSSLLYTPVSPYVAAKMWQVATAVPVVMSHRIARMAVAGPLPQARDRKEFRRMASEKVEAFGESVTNMAFETFRVNQELASQALGQWWRLWTNPLSVPTLVMPQWGRQASRVFAKGFSPVHRRVTANAKRLGQVTSKKKK